MLSAACIAALSGISFLICDLLQAKSCSEQSGHAAVCRRLAEAAAPKA